MSEITQEATIREALHTDDEYGRAAIAALANLVAERDALLARVEKARTLLGDILTNEAVMQDARKVGLGIAGPEHYERKAALREEARTFLSNPTVSAQEEAD